MLNINWQFLLTALLFSTACTAGEYDVTPCGAPQNLAVDPCNQLNKEVNKCDVYQCDVATGSCKLGKRDYDRDGDPDLVCGGKDCDDFDAQKNSFNQACRCDNNLNGKDCFVGVGACRVKATYSCMAGSLFCAQANPPPSSVNYMDHPDPATGSWDWDCSNTLESICGNTTTAMTIPCPAVNCDPTLSDSVIKKNYDAACDTYCSRITNTANCKSAATPMILCGTDCGQPVVTCSCTKPLFSGCTRDTSQKTVVNYVLCK